MELLTWTAVNRKRCNGIPYWREDYVLGYDLDMLDFTELLYKCNLVFGNIYKKLSFVS